MLPIPGNHDYDRKNGSRNAAPYFSYFETEPKDRDGKPLVSQQGKGTGYYALRFPEPTDGPWLLIGLNPYTKSSINPSWPAWLESTLVDNADGGTDKAPCILAFSHPYRFSSGYHGHNDNKTDPNAPTAKLSGLKSAYETLDSHGASVLLSGHDHHFEQFGKQDVDGNSSPDGMRSFIVGTGGGTPYLQNIKVSYATQAANQEHMIPDKFGALRLALYPDHYSWEFLPTQGKAIVPAVHSDTCVLAE